MIRHTPKVFIYYGPSSKVQQEFSLPPVAESISLSQYVRLIEPSIWHKPNEKIVLPATKLVALPEEYFGVTENFVHSFWSRIDNNPVEETYLVNPPIHLVKQAKLYGLDPKITSHAYPSFSQQKLKQLRQNLSSKLFGQETALDRIVKSLIPSLSHDRKKPIILMLYGPAGVGKTETAKLIAKMLGGDPFRAQFSMMQTESLSNYLYGTQTSDRSLSSDLLNRETNVLLFDEFDKTTEHFHSAFYQMFDEGIFKDKNYEVELQGSIILCTSNYASLPEIKRHLGEALYSRISGFIAYQPLSEEAKKIITRNAIAERLGSLTDFSSMTPSSQATYDALVEKISNCQNARDIKLIVDYYISERLYEQIMKKQN